ncbi:MAG: cation diffusion facilitator family transporter [Bacteriovoracales bacterium]
MKSCCENKDLELIALRDKQSQVLKIVLIINATMFFIEFTMGWIVHSTSLLGDSLDMLGDALMYALTLFVLDRSLKSKTRVAFFKGLVLGAFGLGVMVEAISKIFSDILPSAPTMGWIGGLALVANMVCLQLLLRHKNDDLNMKSVFICSRNDIIANVGVLLAAFLVSFFKSRWPDIIVGGVIAVIFLNSAFLIIRESISQMKVFQGSNS